MKLSIAFLCLLVVITSISADLSKFYDYGGDMYEDYDYYEDQNITDYYEGSSDQAAYGASQENPPKKLNPANRDDSDLLVTYSENYKPSGYEGQNVNSVTSTSTQNSGYDKSSNNEPEESPVASQQRRTNLLEEYETENKDSPASINKNKATGKLSPDGGIDFSGCEDDPDTGRCCITKEEKITITKKDPILECTHKTVEQCHYTYVTQFRPSQQQLCEETFEKQCSISFSKKVSNETIAKCYKPLVRVCTDGEDGGGNRGRSGNDIDNQEEYRGGRKKI